MNTTDIYILSLALAALAVVGGVALRYALRSPVTVLVHRACSAVSPPDDSPEILPEKVPCWFVKVHNRSARDVVVTHVGFRALSYTPLTARPLPVRLRPGATFETFIRAAHIPAHPSAQIARCIEVLHTAGRARGRLNTRVAPAGYVEVPV